MADPSDALRRSHHRLARWLARMSWPRFAAIAASCLLVAVLLSFWPLGRAVDRPSLLTDATVREHADVLQRRAEAIQRDAETFPDADPGPDVVLDRNGVHLEPRRIVPVPPSRTASGVVVDPAADGPSYNVTEATARARAEVRAATREAIDAQRDVEEQVLTDLAWRRAFASPLVAVVALLLLVAAVVKLLAERRAGV